jgi:1-acyl-sn-glycerol-3-phosphate acyltransferase
MDLSKVSKDRLEVLNRIQEYEKAGRFDESVENDPPSVELTPDKVDYLCKKLSSKIKRNLANMLGDRHFLTQIKKGNLIIDGVTGEEYLSALKEGAMITCNHFAPSDNYILFHCIRKHLPKKYLYKIIQESNYTAFPGMYGFLFRHCNTLPLSSNRRTMINFMTAVNTLLKNGETILIYPERAMWFNYRKPRPFKSGAFKMAYRAGVPVVPTFITMQDDSERLDENGYPLQRHTVHIMPPVYPDKTLGEKLGAEKMCEQAYELYKAKYEEVYGEKLTFVCDKEEV